LRYRAGRNPEMEPFMKAFVVALSLAALSSPAFAQPTARVGTDRGADNTQSDTRRSGETDATGERLICRSVSSSSTTRMAARRVCRTAEQWRESSRND
jgi:hypothetical protein